MSIMVDLKVWCNVLVYIFQKHSFVVYFHLHDNSVSTAPEYKYPLVFQITFCDMHISDYSDTSESCNANFPNFISVLYRYI